MRIRPGALLGATLCLLGVAAVAGKRLRRRTTLSAKSNEPECEITETKPCPLLQNMRKGTEILSNEELLEVEYNVGRWKELLAGRPDATLPRFIVMKLLRYIEFVLGDDEKNPLDNADSVCSNNHKLKGDPLERAKSKAAGSGAGDPVAPQ